MKQRLGLAFKVGVVIVLIEIVIFSALGIYYGIRISEKSDAAFLQQVRAAARLSAQGSLPFESLAEAEVLHELLGEDVVEGMVVGLNGNIYHAMNSDRIGKTVFELPEINPELFSVKNPSEVIRKITEGDEPFLVCVTPIYTIDGTTPFLFAYFKTSLRAVQKEKLELAELFILIAGIGIIITSLAVYLLFRTMIFKRLGTILTTLVSVESGDLTTRITHTQPKDEVGQLQEGINSMISSLQETVETLKQEIVQRKRFEHQLKTAHDELEERVEERTKELHDLNISLQKEMRERESTEANLRKTNRQLQGILDYSPSMIAIKDLKGRIVIANRRYSEVMGITESNIGDLSDFDFLHQEYALRIKSEHNQVLETLEPLMVEETLHINNQDITLMTTRFPLMDGSGQCWGIGSIATDITDKKHLEAEALRTAQLASLGELAAGVAHEINNPINGIINLAQLMDDALDESFVHKSLPERIIREGERIASIVRSLLSFARSTKEIYTSVLVKEVLEDSLRLTRHQMENDGTEILIDVDDDLPLIEAKPHEIQQVFINLLSNARYALNSKYPGYHPDKQLRISAWVVNVNGTEYLKIVFHDTGVGITNDIKKRLFHPFFSTKPKNEGTGLGLSISYKIINNHNGRLYFESEPFEYTDAIVELPVCRS